MRTWITASIILTIAAPATADSFRDNYSHSTAVAITLTAPTRVTHQESSSGTLAAVARGNDVWFTWSDNGYVCRLAGRINGHTIRFNAGQSCKIDDEDTDSRFKLALVAGSGTVDDDGELDLAMQWKITGSVAGQTVAGAANQRTTAVPF